jgi:hypothetical protein
MEDNMGKTNRGAAYPAITLREATAKLRQAFEKVGKGPSSKEEYIAGLGYSGISGASSRAFASLIHYGLLIKAGAKYRLSDLALRILFPPNDAEPERTELAAAALSPKLFAQLHERYKGQPLPTLLANTLIIDYQIHSKSAQEAATNFRQSLEDAGLLREGVVVGHSEQPKPSQSAEASEIKHELQEGTAEAVSTRQPEEAPPLSHHIEIVLRAGAKASIEAPYNLTAEEKQKLKAIIDLL